MEKTCAKFRKDGYKIVWVVLTRYPLSIHGGQKMTKFTKWKKWQKIISQLHPNHMHTSSYYDENTCKVSKRSVQNCMKSCAHKTPRVNVDGWTNRRTNEWTETCMPKSPMLKQVRQKWTQWNLQNDMCLQLRLRSACTSMISDQSLRHPHEEALGPWLSTECPAKTDQTRRSADLSLRWAHVSFFFFFAKLTSN